MKLFLFFSLLSFLFRLSIRNKDYIEYKTISKMDLEQNIRQHNNTLLKEVFDKCKINADSILFNNIVNIRLKKEDYNSENFRIPDSLNIMYNILVNRRKKTKYLSNRCMIQKYPTNSECFYLVYINGVIRDFDENFIIDTIKKNYNIQYFYQDANISSRYVLGECFDGTVFFFDMFNYDKYKNIIKSEYIEKLSKY